MSNPYSSPESGNTGAADEFTKIANRFGTMSMDTQACVLRSMYARITKEWQDIGLLGRVDAQIPSEQIAPFLPEYTIRRIAKHALGPGVVDYFVRVGRPDPTMAPYDVDRQIALIPVARHTTTEGAMPLGVFTTFDASFIYEQGQRLLREKANSTLPDLSYDFSLPLYSDPDHIR